MTKPTSLQNTKIDVKIKLAVLWTALMFFYVYADFFDQMTPASVESFGSMQTPVGPLTPNLLLIFSSIISLPASMIVLSVFLKPVVGKWLNISVAVLWSIMSFMLLLDTYGNPWYHFYALFQILEIILFIAIALTAWKWPKETMIQPS